MPEFAVAEILVLHADSQSRPPCAFEDMNTASESLSLSETCDGEQPRVTAPPRGGVGSNPEAEPQSRTVISMTVNPIRSAAAASLRRTGEACRNSTDNIEPRNPPEPLIASKTYGGAAGDVWGGNAGKCAWDKNGEPARQGRQNGHAPAVRASIVVEKSGNADGAKGRRKAKSGWKPKIRNCHPRECPRGLTGMVEKLAKAKSLRRKTGWDQPMRMGDPSRAQAALDGLEKSAGRAVSSAKSNLPTGEPDAGDPPVRFGGRGSGESRSPYPYK